MSTPQSLRSIVAGRYLEVLANYARGHDDDLDEYCRQFQLCSEFVSTEHVSSRTLAALFIAGLPSRVINSTTPNKHYIREVNEPKYPVLGGNDLARLIKNVREQIAGIRGVPRLASSSHTADIDRLLMYMEIKKQPKADFAEVAKFERFHAMLTSLNDDQLAQAVAEGKVSAAPTSPSMSSWGGSESDQVLFTPSTSSYEGS